MIDNATDYDFYTTDPIAINDLLVKMPELRQKGLKVLEPCAGIGFLADRYTFLTNNKVDMYDIVKRREDIIEMDYMELNCKNKYDLIITNFPHKKAIKNRTYGFSELLNKALIDIKPNGYVCSFQRLSQLESKERYEKIYSKCPPSQIFVYSRRLKCFKEKMDDICNTSICYSWAIWHKKLDGSFDKDTKLSWIY